MCDIWLTSTSDIAKNIPELVYLVHFHEHPHPHLPWKSVSSRSLTPQFVTVTDVAMIYVYQPVTIQFQTFHIVRLLCNAFFRPLFQIS